MRTSSPVASTTTLVVHISFALALAACGGNREAPDTTASASTPAAATPAAEPERQKPDWCALLPASEVSATLQRTVGKSVSIAKPSAGGGCTYRDVEQGAPEMQLLIELLDVGSDSAATESMKVVRGMFADRGQPVVDVAGVGDAAFGAWEAETYGLKLRKGRYTGQVNVNARRFKDPAVEQAARELAKQMVAKL
ncbi:MAG TPA: hypothetical protein VF761_10215 [Gemmatimonadaceae bacterium]